MSNSLRPIDCSVPGSSVHGIFQAAVLEWIAISFSRGSSQPRARTQVSAPNIRTVWISLVAQMVKNPLAMQETWVQSLGWEDPLEKGKATHSSILAWKIPWTEEPGRLQSMGLHKSRARLIFSSLIYQSDRLKWIQIL